MLISLIVFYPVFASWMVLSPLLFFPTLRHACVYMRVEFEKVRRFFVFFVVFCLKHSILVVYTPVPFHLQLMESLITILFLLYFYYQMHLEE